MEREIVTTNGTAHAQSTSATSTAQSHPLQDVELNGNSNGNFNENVPVASMDLQQQQQQTTKQTKNWVKFEEDDDDDNNVDDALSGSSSAAVNNNNTNDNNENSATQQQQQNKLATLSPPPPSVVKSNNTRARSRSPNERQQAVMESAAAAAAAAAAAPMQRTKQTEVAPAVLTTESTHVDLTASGRQHQQHQQQQQQHQLQQHTQSQLQQAQHKNQKLTNLNSSQQQQQHQHQQQAQSQHNGAPNALKSSTDAATTSGAGSVTIPVETSGGGGGGGPTMRTIELSTGRIREGFANGDVIVTLLPANTKWPWITPAIFRPELVPEELMAQGLTLTVEDYVNAMETLVNDYRFTVYNICYKRILVCWILFAFAVLLTLLFSGLQGVALFSLGVGWLFLNAAAIFLCMWVKLRLSRGLEKCLARVNKQLMRHKILLVLDDRGRISCHKVNLCFLYFDATQCVNFLNEFLEQTEQNGGEAIKAGWEAKLDIDMNDIVIQGTNPVRLSRKQERGMQLFLRYGSRWGMEALRGLVDITPFEPGRHCGQFQCPCQYIKQHLQCKPRGKFKCFDCVHWVLASERYDY